MHRVLVTLTALSAGCSLFGTPCPQRVEAMKERLDAWQPAAAEVDPWALPAVDPGPVPLDALAKVDLPYAPSSATRAVAIDATGGRFVDGVAVGAGRGPLCAALAFDGDEGPRVRVHAAATARATAVLELFADLHSCKAYNLDVVVARKVPPWVDRVDPTTPFPADCPVDRTTVAAAATPAEKSVALADALLTADGDCGCPVEDHFVLAAWQAEALPTAFVTSFAVRPSPSAPPFDVAPHEPWQDAAERFIVFAGPDPLSHPLMVWFANEGSLAPTDNAPIHINPP